MTELMLPLLEKAAPDARVITVASGGMYTVPLTKDLQVTFLQKSNYQHHFIYLILIIMYLLNAVY